MTILKGSEKIVASLNQFGVVRRVRGGVPIVLSTGKCSPCDRIAAC